MLDDFRRQAADSFLDEDQEQEYQPPTGRRIPTRFLGMTPPQIFFVSLLLLIITCLASAFCLLASGIVAPPNF